MESWLPRIAALSALAILATGLAALAENRMSPSFGLLVAVAIFVAGVLWGLSRVRSHAATWAALVCGSGLAVLACVQFSGTSLGLAVSVLTPFVVVTAAVFGATAAFLIADGAVVVWAVALGLSAGGFASPVSNLDLEPTRALLTLAAVGVLLNSVALACGWWLRVGTPEAHAEIDALQSEQRQLVAEVHALQPLASAGRLVAHVAHEVSNPIQAIDNMIFVLLDQTPEKDSRRPLLLMMKEGVERITQYLGQLSEFYRPTATTTSADLNRTIEDVFRFLARQLANSNIKVVQELAPDLLPAHIAEEPLRQIVLNVVLNAVDAMPDGGEFGVSTAQVEDAVIAIFQDSGPGIAQQDIDRIFEPFFTTKEGRGGVGLGLSISQRIARGHGGEMTAENTPAGARFCVRLRTARPETVSG